MAATKEDILNAISNMTVMEIVDLVKMMEDKFGVTAAAPMAMMAGGGAAAAPAAAVEEQTEFAVTMTSFGANKVGVIKVIRETHRPRPQGSQGPRRGRALAGQGLRAEGRRRRDQEEARRGRRFRGDQVTAMHGPVPVAARGAGRRHSAARSPLFVVFSSSSFRRAQAPASAASRG